MVELENPKTWTKSYVITHRAECLLFLREMNLSAIHYIEEGKFFSALASMNDAILNGLMVMKSSGKYGDLRPYLAGYSCVCGEVSAFADADTMLREMREMGVNPKYTLSQTKKNLRDNATEAFLDALDFSTGDRMKKYITAVLKDLADGVPADQIRREYASDFPADAQDILLDVDSRFFVPELLRCAPERCLHLDRRRLIFTRELETGGVPSQFGPVTGRPSGKKRGKKKGPSFDEWMEANGWDEEDLEWAYRRVKRRRNIYGILLLIPPLGILLLPFWLRAVYLTKAIYYRDMDVDFNKPTYFVLFCYGLPSLFIYPMIMGAIVSWSSWGMGLGSKRARVLNILLLTVLIASLAVSLADSGAFDGISEKVRSLPDRAAALLRREDGGEAAVPEAEETLEGRWYSVSLYCSEESPEPDSMFFRYYDFKDDGTCDNLYRQYQRADTGLPAFQSRWQLVEDHLSHETYAVDGEMGLSICVEGAPPGHFFENDVFDYTYFYTLRNGTLSIAYDGSETVYYRTDLDYGDAEQLIAGLSGQTQRLTGAWTTARRNERSEIETATYTFGMDGTVTLSPCVYLNSAYEPDLAEGEQGWFAAPMGHPSTYGTYTFDGKSVVMEFLSDDVTGSDEWINWTEVYTVGGDLESALELDGERYVPEDYSMDRESLWAAAGVDFSVH